MAFVTVEGIITRTNSKGFKLEETTTLNDGRSFPKFWTIWGFNEDALEGDHVQIKGELSAKILKDYMTGEDKLTQKGERMVDLIVNATEKTLIKRGPSSTDRHRHEHDAPLENTTLENAPF